MAKRPTITTVTTGFQSGATMNENFEALRDGFDNTLSLDGSTPNAMGADLDMNNNDILNVGSIQVQGVALVPNNVATIPDWEGVWLTGTTYAVNDLVRQDGNVYICLIAHTAGTFSTDLAASRWELFASKGDSGAGTGDLLSANNLSDLADTDAALANLGGGTVGIALFKDTTAAAARTELGLGNIATTDLIDEDNMASNLDTRAPTQQSVKAYVDAEVSGYEDGEDATTSGSTHDFTNIPAGINEIDIFLDSVSLTGSNDFLIQIGTGGVPTTTGYFSVSTDFVNNSTATNGFVMRLGVSSRTYTVLMQLRRIPGTNKWHSVHFGANDNVTALSPFGNGYGSLSGTLDNIRLRSSISDTFDAGTWSIRCRK